MAGVAADDDEAGGGEGNEVAGEEEGAVLSMIRAKVKAASHKTMSSVTCARGRAMDLLCKGRGSRGGICGTWGTIRLDFMVHVSPSVCPTRVGRNPGRWMLSIRVELLKSSYEISDKQKSAIGLRGKLRVGSFVCDKRKSIAPLNRDQSRVCPIQDGARQISQS